MLGAGVAQGRKVYSFECALSRAKKNRRDSKVHFVDQALAKKLLDDVDTATKTDVLFFGGFAGLSKRGGNSVRYEVESSSAFHRQRCTRMVGEHEDGAVIHRVLAPPTPPVLIRPWSTNGAEHVSTKDPCADVPKPSSSEVIIDSPR